MTSVGVSYANVILDEICLEGLDGITIQGLWLRLADRFECKVPDVLKRKFWNIIVTLRDIDFYLLPEPRADLEIVKRFVKTDGEYFVSNAQEENLQVSIYPLHPVSNDYGSCQHYNTRVNINSEAKKMMLEDAVNNWGNKLVMVGNLLARWHSLSPGSPPLFEVLNKAQYCVLESIGRNRYNGETTWKMMSVKGEADDPKTLFYHRKILVNYNLVVQKPICVRTSAKNTIVNNNTIILHLTRFNIPFVSKADRIIKKIVELIESSPTKMVSFVKAKQSIKGLLDREFSNKNFFKLSEISRVILTTTVPYKELHPDATPEQCVSKSNGFPINVRVVKINKQNIQDNQIQDEDDITLDGEISGSGFVGETLLHQAYNCVYDAGPTGITRTSLSKLLGIDILSARTLLRRLQYRDNLQIVLTEDKRQKQEYFVCPDFLKFRNAEFENEKMKTDNVIQSNKHRSLKKLRLTNIILEQIRYRHIIHEFSNLTKYCDRQQHALGVNTGVVDRRTILRIVKDLDQQGLARYYKIKLEPKYNSKVLSFICEPHITTDHPFIQSVIEQTKMSSNTSNEGKKSVTPIQTNPVLKSNISSNSNKFLKTSILHKFLFYIVYGHENRIVDDMETFCIYNEKFKELSEVELSPVYEGAPAGFTFVPPINKYSGWPEGWMILADMFLCMPLFVFTQIISIPLFPLLEEYLKHPIKRQVLLKNTPNEIQQAILWKKKYLYSVVERLCFIGLVKFGQRVMKDKFRIFVYINRVSGILDTTTSEPSYNQVEDKSYNEEFFTFDTLENVEGYWSRLQHICLNTIMGIPSSVMGKEITILSPERKLAEYLRSYSVSEATETDIGTVPGDRRGAGGIDSSLYSHLKRSWGIIDFGIKTASVPRGNGHKKGSFKLIRKKPKVSRNIELFVGNSIPSKVKGKIIKRTIKPRKRSRIRKTLIDEEDKIALNNMPTQRTHWTPKEDRIIILTAIACNILGQKNLFSTMTREMLYRITKVRDKTSISCRRRLLHLKKKNISFRNIEIHMSEIQQNTNVMTQYSQLYKRLWVKENSDEYPKFAKEIQIHFIELVHYLHRMIYSKEMVREFMALPASLPEIDSRFHTYSSEIQISENHTEPTAIDDISHSKAQSVIHITLSSESKNNFSSKRHALKVFLQFGEELLRTAVSKINSLGMAVRSKKIKTKQQSSSQLSSSYSLSQMYMYHLCSPTPYAAFSELFSSYKTIVQNDLRKIDCKSLDSGMAVLLTDLRSLYALEMNLFIPRHILIPDPRQRIENALDDPSDVTSVDEKIVSVLNEATVATSSIQVIENSMPHSQDAVVVNTCRLETTLNQQLTNIFFDITVESIHELLNKWISDAIFEFDDKSMCELSLSFHSHPHKDLSQEIYTFIESKEIMGAFCADIKKQFSAYDKFLLQDIIITLKDAKLIFRVGVKKLRWVSIKYFQSWFIKIKEPISLSGNISDILKRRSEEKGEASKAKRVKFSDELDVIEFSIDKFLTDNTDREIQSENTSDAESSLSNTLTQCISNTDDFLDNLDCDDSKVTHNTFMCARVWMKLDGSLNYRNIWRWLGAVLCYLVNHPTVSLENLCKRFPFIFPFHMQLLVEMLVDMECVKLFVIHKSKVSLWDEDSNYSFEDASILDECSDIHVTIRENSLVRFSYYRGMAIDAKKSQDSTFSLEEVSQTGENMSQVEGSVNAAVCIDDEEEIWMKYNKPS